MTNLQKYFHSDYALIVVAYENQDGMYKLMGVMQSDKDGDGEWVQETGTVSLNDLAYVGGDRYMHGRPIVREGVNYVFLPKFSSGPSDDTAVNLDKIEDIIKGILADAQVMARPIKVLADALWYAKEQVTFNITIRFQGAKRTANWYRIDDGDPVHLHESVLLNEAGVNAACRAYDWRMEGPFHQGGHSYNILFFPGDQNGLTISSKTDVQERTEKYQKLESWSKAAMNNAATEADVMEYLG